MRNALITLAAAVSAFALAAPAAAQYYPAPPGYGQGYGQGYGHGYGYGYRNNHGQVRRLQARLDQTVRHINRLDRRDMIRDREANRLRAEARDIGRRLHSYARNGLNRRERGEIEYRIGRLDQRIAMVARDGHRWGRSDRRWNDYWASSERNWRPDDRRWGRDDDDDDDDNRGRRGRGDRDDD